MRVFGKKIRGSVILIVLITIMFAAVALTLFIEKASNDLLVEARDADASRLRSEAYSALETTLGVLEDFRGVLGQLHSPNEGWGDPLGFAGYEPDAGTTVDIGFEDESAKMSLPNADATTLAQVFTSWGLPQANAEKLRDALMGWMHSDYVGSTAGAPRPEDYDKGDLPFVPPGRSLRSFTELGTIAYARDVFYDEKGEPNELWHRFASAFSLYNYKTPNINGGNPDVLLGLGIQDKSQVQLVQDYLSGHAAHQSQSVPYFRSSQEIAGLLGASSPAVALGTQIMALRIFVTGYHGRALFRLTAVVAPQGGASIPSPPSNSVAATIASTTATNGSTPQNAATPAASNASTSTSPTDGGAVQSGAEIDDLGDGEVTNSLNYPFTILEIRENDQSPSAPADLTR